MAADREAVEAPQCHAQRPSRALRAPYRVPTTPEIPDPHLRARIRCNGTEEMKDLRYSILAALQERLAPTGQSPRPERGIHRDETHGRTTRAQATRQSAMPLFCHFDAYALATSAFRQKGMRMADDWLGHLIEKAQNSLEPEKLSDVSSVREHIASLV